MEQDLQRSTEHHLQAIGGESQTLKEKKKNIIEHRNVLIQPGVWMSWVRMKGGGGTMCLYQEQSLNQQTFDSHDLLCYNNNNNNNKCEVKVFTRTIREFYQGWMRSWWKIIIQSSSHHSNLIFELKLQQSSLLQPTFLPVSAPCSQPHLLQLLWSFFMSSPPPHDCRHSQTVFFHSTLKP